MGDEGLGWGGVSSQIGSSSSQRPGGSKKKSAKAGITLTLGIVIY